MVDYDFGIMFKATEALIYLLFEYPSRSKMPNNSNSGTSDCMNYSCVWYPQLTCNHPDHNRGPEVKATTLSKLTDEAELAFQRGQQLWCRFSQRMS
jgi:hypothetical protein